MRLHWLVQVALHHEHGHYTHVCTAVYLGATCPVTEISSSFTTAAGQHDVGRTDH